MKKTLWPLISLMLLASCASDDPVMTGEFNSKETEGGAFSISLKDALDRADLIFAELDKGATRAVSRIPSSVETIHSTATRGSEDELFYLINYSDNTGFALMSADSRISDPFYAISEEGSLNLNDTVDNKGLAFFFQNAINSASNDIQSSGTPYPGGWNPINPPLPPMTPVIMKFGPLLAESVRSWGQYSPYNMYYDKINGQLPPTGCTVTACAMLFSYYKWPQAYNGHYFPWDGMISGSCDDRVARLMKVISDKENLNIQPALSGSSTVEWRVGVLMDNMGYEKVNYYTDFTASVASDAIKGNGNDIESSPLYVSCSGYTLEDEDGDGEEEKFYCGHAWVVDGVLDYYLTKDMITPTPYFHCVWGWNGLSNGYYLLKDGYFNGTPDFVEEGEDITTENHFTSTESFRFVKIKKK